MYIYIYICTYIYIYTHIDILVSVVVVCSVAGQPTADHVSGSVSVSRYVSIYKRRWWTVGHLAALRLADGGGVGA